MKIGKFNGRGISPNIVMNTRTLLNEFSGVQRCARELQCRINPNVILPTSRWGAGFRGHFWEQIILPWLIGRDSVLFSPANVGPLLVSRQVVIIHDMATFDHPEWFAGAFARWYRFITPRLVQGCAHIVTVSKSSKAAIINHTNVPARKVSVVYNGVDLDAPVGAGEMETLGERVLSVLEGGRRYLLYVGSMEPRKNLDRLLAAWTRLRYDDTDLVFCGGGLLRVFSGSPSSRMPPGVVRLGRVSDLELRMLLRKASGFVYPSLYEGFGLPPLEAMAMGCPVLISNISVHREICGSAASDGGAVEYFDPYSIESISEAMDRLLGLDASERERRIRLGQVRCSRFRWDRMAEQIETILNSVARDQNLPILI